MATIEELIYALETAKAIHGGDKAVYFWNRPEDRLEIERASLLKVAANGGSLTPDGLSLGFEVFQAAPED